MKKRDLYTAMAARAFGVPYEEVALEQRCSIKKGMIEAIQQGPKSVLERAVIQTPCTATTQGPFGTVVLTGSFEAVTAAMTQLRHEIEALEIGVGEGKRSPLERSAIQSAVMRVLEEMVT